MAVELSDLEITGAWRFTDGWSGDSVIDKKSYTYCLDENDIHDNARYLEDA